MVDLLEISLLSELVIGRSRFLSDDTSLIYLFLELGKHVRELNVLFVNLWDFWHLIHIELASCLEFKPLLLKAIKCAFHAEFNEKVSQELVTILLSSLRDFREKLSGVHLALLNFQFLDCLLLKLIEVNEVLNSGACVRNDETLWIRLLGYF